MFANPPLPPNRSFPPYPDASSSRQSSPTSPNFASPPAFPPSGLDTRCPIRQDSPVRHPAASDPHHQAIGVSDSDATAKVKPGKGGTQPRKRGRKRIGEDESTLRADTDKIDSEAKRKLQNRAAQRAFRERKEKHVSDLEERVKKQEHELNEFRTVIRNLYAENEALRRGEQPPRTVLPPLEECSASTRSTVSPTPSGALSAAIHQTESPPEIKPSIRCSPPAAAATPVYLPPPIAPLVASPATGFPAASTPLPPAQTYYPPPALPSLTLPSEHATPAPPSLAPLSLAPPPPAPAYPIDTPMHNYDSSTFDFDAPFDFNETLELPPLLNTLMADLDAAGFFSTTPVSSAAPLQSSLSDDACPNSIDDDDTADPPPLPNGRIPCDKPICDFSSTSCALPIPWRPPPVSSDEKDLWVAQKCWAKLYSHPLFSQCNPDELCQLLRDKTRCSDDGRLVCHKSDVCDIFRSIPQRAKARNPAADRQR
ncbi:hypothetical protein JCM11641_007365 [Rhodosporidiobolus odoratus]